MLRNCQSSGDTNSALRALLTRFTTLALVSQLFALPTSAEEALSLEEQNVRRLHQLLQDYHDDTQAAQQTGPSEDEIARRELAQRDAERLAKIPYSVEKVRLNGAEGSTAMAHISRRLANPGLPDSRRDIAPICIIKTRLFDTLIGSQNRSLQPVGKNHYVATVTLQAGETSLNIKSTTWELQLPEHVQASEFIITFYRPPGSAPELHVFAIEDLLATDGLHIPQWLPPEIQAKLKQE